MFVDDFPDFSSVKALLHRQRSKRSHQKFPNVIVHDTYTADGEPFLIHDKSTPKGQKYTIHAYTSLLKKLTRTKISFVRKE